MQVDVYLNVNTRDSFMYGWNPEHKLVKAATIEVEAIFDRIACGRIYRLLNVGDDPDFGEPDDRAIEYRRNRNRSLSVGDVLVSRDRAFAVAGFGFTMLPDGTKLNVVDGHWSDYDGEGNLRD